MTAWEMRGCWLCLVGCGLACPSRCVTGWRAPCPSGAVWRPSRPYLARWCWLVARIGRGMNLPCRIPLTICRACDPPPKSQVRSVEPRSAPHWRGSPFWGWGRPPQLAASSAPRRDRPGMAAACRVGNAVGRSAVIRRCPRHGRAAARRWAKQSSCPRQNRAARRVAAGPSGR